MFLCCGHCPGAGAGDMGAGWIRLLATIPQIREIPGCIPSVRKLGYCARYGQNANLINSRKVKQGITPILNIFMPN